jgi:ribosomal protein S18 acetylase RimI-like enzyme
MDVRNKVDQRLEVVVEASRPQLYISPSIQRRGIGELLLRRAMEEMPTGFTLRTASANISARAFCERMGLKLLAEGTQDGSAGDAD